MSRKSPPVRETMTHLPVEAERCDTVGDAMRVMEAEQIRHIPVMRGAKLVGIVSHRDILQALATRGNDVQDLALEELCEPDVITVPPTMQLGEVAEKMLARRAGSVVVMDGGFVVGIFTETDALRFLREWFGPTG